MLPSVADRVTTFAPTLAGRGVPLRVAVPLITLEIDNQSGFAVVVMVIVADGLALSDVVTL